MFLEGSKLLDDFSLRLGVGQPQLAWPLGGEQGQTRDGIEQCEGSIVQNVSIPT